MQKKSNDWTTFKFNFKSKKGKQFKEILSSTDIVLLCDDSSKMVNIRNSKIMWDDVREITYSIIRLVTLIKGDGVDIYFLNRPTLKNVTNVEILNSIFSINPEGNRPLMRSINKIYNDNIHKQLHLIVITDSLPCNQNINILMNNINNKNEKYISFILLNSNLNNLHEWYKNIEYNKYIKVYDQNSKYQENNILFNYTDYIIDILSGFYSNKITNPIMRPCILQ